MQAWFFSLMVHGVFFTSLGLVFIPHTFFVVQTNLPPVAVVFFSEKEKTIMRSPPPVVLNKPLPPVVASPPPLKKTSTPSVVHEKKINHQPSVGMIACATNAPLLYPLKARREKKEGTGIFQLHLTHSGKVSHVTFLSGDLPKILKNAAIKTLLTWCFVGETLPSSLEIPIKYSLSEG